jgi:hypothetical protein
MALGRDARDRAYECVRTGVGFHEHVDPEREKVFSARELLAIVYADNSSPVCMYVGNQSSGQRRPAMPGDENVIRFLERALGLYQQRAYARATVVGEVSV